jgi:hypothetical protein
MNEEKQTTHILDTALQDLRALRMTADERARILDKIHTTAPARKPGAEKFLGTGMQAAPSAADGKSPFAHLSMIIGILVAVVLLVGGGISTAAGDSLPGDLFYPVKTDFFEPIRISMAGTAASIARVEASLVNTRLSEAETLATAGKLNDAKRMQIEKLLNKHTVGFGQALAAVETESPQNVSVLTSALRATFELHAKLMNQFTAYASTSNVTALTPLKHETDLHVLDPRAPWSMPVPEATSSDFHLQNFRK